MKWILAILKTLDLDTILDYWKLVLGLILGAVMCYPLAYCSGVKNQRIAAESQTLLVSAKNDVATVGAISMVRTEYQPLYVEVEKYVETPTCNAPPVILDTVQRLRGQSKTRH